MNTSHWHDVHNFPVVDWKYEVGNDDTRLSYRDWVGQKERSAAADRNDLLSGDGAMLRDRLTRLVDPIELTRYERLTRYGVWWPLFLIGLPAAVGMWIAAVMMYVR